MPRLAQLDDAEVEQAVIAALRDRVLTNWHDTIEHLAVQHDQILRVSAHRERGNRSIVNAEIGPS